MRAMTLWERQARLCFLCDLKELGDDSRDEQIKKLHRSIDKCMYLLHPSLRFSHEYIPQSPCW